MRNFNYDKLDRKNIEFILNSKDKVTVVYRIGSRAEGIDKFDSDTDYLILLDRENHYCSSNNFFCSNSEMDIDIFYFTKKDLQEPEKMLGKRAKLLLLFGAYKIREFSYGEDVFDKWLSPNIELIFEQNRIAEEFKKVTSPEYREMIKKAVESLSLNF